MISKRKTCCITANSFLIYIKFFLLSSNTLLAQQVNKIECCLDVGSKAIIVNNTDSSTSNTNNKTITVNGIINFTLTDSARTSAGVYNSSGTLVRTLWSGVRYGAGCYIAQWDGYLDDNTTTAPFGTYNVKILTNNVHYDWLGVLGNSSKSHLQKEFVSLFYSMCTVNNSLYYAGGYAERDIKTNKVVLSEIGESIPAIDPNQGTNETMCAYRVCTNGTYVFWAGGDGDPNSSNRRSFIVASKPADDSQVTFANGQQVAMYIDGRVYNSALVINTNTSYHDIKGMAVTTNYLFASHENQNIIDIYDLRGLSGALINSINLGYPVTALATYGDYLWANVNSTTVQYHINNDGALSATGVTINADADDIAISPAGEMCIADANTQQLKFYNANTGIATGTILGLLGGYDSNGPLVTNNKFMFNKIGEEEALHVSLTYEANGSLWFSDIGNQRVLHFNPDKSYKEQIAYMSVCRSIDADSNNPTRVFDNALERQVDYTKVVSDINSSWALTYNWANAALGLGGFHQVVTLSNRHTYATTPGGDHQNLFELNPTSGPIALGTIDNNLLIETDGSLWNRGGSNGYTVASRAPLTGFDSNNRPLWGAFVAMATAPPYDQDPNQPVFYVNNTRGSATNPRAYFWFQQNWDPGNQALYHLGSMKYGTSTWNWKTSKTVPFTYDGAYPENGWFMFGGHSENCIANVNGSNIFWHVNDELGKYTEACRTNHFNEDGLFIGHFGTDNKTVGLTGDTRFYAGNSFITRLLPVGNDLYYIYCDESKHGGIHLIKISNLASIREQTKSVTVSAPVTATPDAYSLMAGLPKTGALLTSLVRGANGWTIESGSPTIQTGLRELLGTDIAISGNYGDRTVSRSLGTQTLNSYTITGGINFAGSQVTFDDRAVSNYLILTDQEGKNIAVLYYLGSGIYVNNVFVAPSSGANGNFWQDFSFTCSASALTFQFASYPPISITRLYDSSANITKPGFLKVTQHNRSDRRDNVSMDLYKLRFVPKLTN